MKRTVRIFIAEEFGSSPFGGSPEEEATLTPPEQRRPVAEREIIAEDEDRAVAVAKASALKWLESQGRPRPSVAAVLAMLDTSGDVVVTLPYQPG